MKSERGTAMFELLILGFAIVAVILPSLLAVTTLAGARGVADTAAVDAAAWYARHGALPAAGDEDVTLSVTASPDGIRVLAVVDVSLVGIGRARISIPVRRVAYVPISPFRSGR